MDSQLSIPFFILGTQTRGQPTALKALREALFAFASGPVMARKGAVMSAENNYDWENASEQKQGLLKLLEEQIYHSSMSD